jgi:hypothetical protein
MQKKIIPAARPFIPSDKLIAFTKRNTEIIVKIKEYSFKKKKEVVWLKKILFTTNKELFSSPKKSVKHNNKILVNAFKLNLSSINPIIKKQSEIIRIFFIF